MKNVKETQLKKAIFLTYEEYVEVVNNVTDGLVEVDLSYEGLDYLVTDKAEETETYFNMDITDALAEYYNVKEVTSVHADDCEAAGVWIIYNNERKEEEENV